MRITVCCFLLATTFGCQSTGPASVPSAMLAYVPESGRREVEQSRQQLDAANEELAIARRDADEVDSLVNLSRNDLDVACARHEEAVEQTEHAERYGSRKELDAMTERREEAQDAVRLARAKVRYYEDLQSLARERVVWIQERVALADARHELTKAEAVAELDRPVAKDLDITAYGEAVAVLEDEVARLAVEVEVARRRAVLQADFVDAMRQRVPETFRLNEIAPIDEVFFSELAADKPDPLVREASFRGGLETSTPKNEDEPGTADGGR